MTNYKYSFGDYIYPNIKLPKTIHEASTDELKAELKRREQRDELLKDMTWKNVMNVTNDKVPGGLTFSRIAEAASLVGYKYFVVEGYAEVYQVLGVDYDWRSCKSNGHHFKSLPVKRSDIK